MAKKIISKKIIEKIALILGVVLTLVTVITIPLVSYNNYKDYLEEIKEQSEANKQQTVKAVLESITAELKDGVSFFANDMAEVRAEHFNVTANYTKEGESPWSEPVEEGAFSVNAPVDFYSKGGDVTVTYKNVSTVVSISLEPVVLESITVTVSPYTVKYRAGDRFDASGMEVKALYNDGSSKVLSADQYSVDKGILAMGDSAVAVSFNDGSITKTAEVEIGVLENLDNGDVTSIVIVGDAIVYAGNPIDTATMEVNAVYESGNRRPLSRDEYTVEAVSGGVEFGRTYRLKASYNDDPTKTAEKDVKVRKAVEGEDGIIVGGSVNTETEYAIIDGVITELDNDVSFAGGFSKAVLDGEAANLTLLVNAAAATVGDVTVRCSNSYNVYYNGSNSSGGYAMKPLQINTILDLTVNGREVKVPATVILRGCGPYETYAPLYGIYYEFTFEGVQLDAGVNNVKFNFKKSTVGATNCWGESPSTLNIDRVYFDSYGSEIPDQYTIVGLEISNTFTVEYGTAFDEVDVPVVAVIDNGTRIGLSKDLYDVTVTGENATDDSFGFGKHVIKVTLKENPSITVSHNIDIPVFQHFVVLTAGVEVVDERVLYYFTGESIGYKAEDVEFFDGATVYPIEFTINGTSFRFCVDVTDATVGHTYWPHLRLDGINYENGANAAGDVRDRGLTFTNGQSVALNGKIYTITTQYSMPTLVVEKSADGSGGDTVLAYDANIDNSYVSDKALVGKYVYGSDGTETTGTDKSSEYAGGIGNMDKANRYVTYTFTLEEDGTVDFVWNIAGSYYKSGTNVGIENAAKNVKVLIDGVAVDMEGIALPAGDGSSTSLWWNLQRVVIKNVALKAGTHTFTCIILTEGSGLNVGSMEIYAA